MPTIDGPRHGFHVYDVNGRTRAQAMVKAAELGSDVVRVQIYWHQIQPGSSSDWITASLDTLISTVATIRSTVRPNFKLLPMIDGIPTWVPGRASAHYTNTMAGCEQYGVAVQRILSYLGDYADYVELSNEPNVKTSSSAAACEIPSDWYGMMGAYAITSINNCITDKTKGILFGALDLLTGPDNWVTGTSTHWVNGPPTNYIQQALASYDMMCYYLNGTTVGPQLSARARVSCHPYPILLSDLTASSASNRTFSKYDRIAAVVGGRKMWITEVGTSSYNMNGSDPTHVTGLTAQSDYTHNLFLGSTIRHADSGQLEGLIYWPMADDPGFVGGQFQETGVLDYNFANKPAANRLITDWAYWN